MSKILGNGAPTINTPGAVGQEYLDKSTGTVYMCTQAKHYPAGKSGESDGEYTWEPAGGSASWNDLTDKPFGEEGPAPIIFDGKLEGMTVITHPGEENMKEEAAGLTEVCIKLVKVSDNFYSKEKLCQLTITRFGLGFGEIVENTTSMSADDFSVAESDMLSDGDATLIYDNDMTIMSVDRPVSLIIPGAPQVDIPEKGLWTWYLYVAQYGDGTPMEQYISKITFPVQVKKMDEKYLPESVERVVVRSSTPDSTKKFKLTVDDNGTISATEVTE